MSGTEYQVMLFKSVSHALLAEKTLKALGIPHKLIPVPRHISSDCGVCLRFISDDRGRIEQALAGTVSFEKIQPL
ncbi:MAG: DUF3343 domain-containing protein [Syntrophaceae bacterium]